MIISINLTENELTAIGYLRDHVEFDDGGWGTVCLSNAKPSDWSDRTWSGVLGSLAKKGLYVPECGDDGCFGEVKL